MTSPIRARSLTRTTENVLARADELLTALDTSLVDLHHREHVMGVLRGSAPTFTAALERLIAEARKARGARGEAGPRGARDTA